MSQWKTVSEYNSANREAPTAAASLARGTGNFARSKARPKDRSDGKMKCANKGCGKIYDPAENGPSACSYHSGLPVFGGMEKWWRCCPENGKFWEFEEFRKIKPCCAGPHVDEREAYDRAQEEAEQAVAANPDLKVQQMNIHAAMGYDGRRTVA